MKNTRAVVSLLVGIIILGATLHFHGATQSAVTSLGRIPYSQTASFRTSRSFDKARYAGVRVAVDESTIFHNEVIAATLFQLNDLGVNATMYRHSWGRGNDEIIKEFYQGPDPIFQQGEEGQDVLSEAVNRGEYDIVYLVTCEGTLWVRPGIMEAVAKNPNVQLFCVMHFVWEIEKYKAQIKDVAATGRMTIYVLSEAVKRLAVLRLSQWAQADKYSGWDNLKVEVFTPIFTLPEKVAHRPESKGIGYNHVGIQGGLHQTRRDYRSTFQDLLASIKEYPDVWGYTIPKEEDQPFRPKAFEPGTQAPFELHLIGDMGDQPLDVPPQLAKVIKFHLELEQGDYYRVLGQMDLILPAFGQDGYFLDTASSTIPTGLITRTPILSNPRHLEAYTYLGPVNAVVHPTSMRPVEAIRLLRQGHNPWAREMKRPIPFSKSGNLGHDGSCAVQDTPTANNMGKHSDALWNEHFELIRRANRDMLVDMLEPYTRRSVDL